MKTYLLLAGILLTCFSAFAQTKKSDERISFARKFGYKAGVNIVTYPKLSNDDPYLGYHIGLFGETRISRIIGYGAEFNYSRQGLTYFDADVNLNYLTAPVYLNIYDGPITFQAGMYFSYLFYAGMENRPDNGRVTDHFKNTDYGIIIGVRCKPGGDFLFGGHLNMGLMDINSDLYLTRPFTPLIKPKEDFKTLNAQVYVGHMF